MVKDIKSVWDNVYTERGSNVPWATENWLNASLPDIINFIVSNGIKIDSLLDYGAGTGHFALALKSALNIPKVIAADISDKGLDKQRLVDAGIDFIITDQPKDVGGKYDVILCWAVFHHIDSKYYKDFLSQFHSMLNDDGVLLLGAWSSEDKHFAGKETAPGVYSGVTMYSMKSLESGKVFDEVGFKVAASGKIINDFDLEYRIAMKVSDRLLQYYFLKKS